MFERRCESSRINGQEPDQPEVKRRPVVMVVFFPQPPDTEQK